MKPPLFVRPLSNEEAHTLKQALRAKDGFTLRRAQILLGSSQGQQAAAIAESLGCATQTVYNTIHDFNNRGLAVLLRQSNRPKTMETAFDATTRERLFEIAHASPRLFGKARSLWSLETLAEVAFEQGLTKEQVSIETIRRAIHALGSSWQRAKDWITSPDPQYELKKSNSAA
jgi:transposase